MEIPPCLALLWIIPFLSGCVSNEHMTLPGDTLMDAHIYTMTSNTQRYVMISVLVLLVLLNGNMLIRTAVRQAE